MKSILTCLLTFSLLQIYAQENKEAYRSNQYKLDQKYGGIGLTFTKPNFGKGIEIPNRWYGANVQSDFLEFEFLVGETNKIQPLPTENNLEYPLGDYGSDFGYLLSGGANFPINFLNFGAYQNPMRILRGHPTLGTNLGFGTFKRADQFSGRSRVYYWGLKAGYRLRFPLVSIEFNLNARLGWSTAPDATSSLDLKFYRGTGISPSITIRFDALKGIFNPRMVAASVQSATVSNIDSKTERTGTRYVGNTRYETYTTTTTGTVNVTSGNIGIQDIGAHFGIGPKISFMNPIRSNYIQPSFLFGLEASGRKNVLDYGLTIEGGRVGHGSVLEFKGVAEPRRKLNKKESDPVGRLNTVNLYGSFGFDISPAFFVPFGIAIDKGESTSFFSATAGLNLGVHVPFGQEFDDSTSTAYFEQLYEDEKETGVKEKHINPAVTDIGLLAGFYFSVQVGAASFKVTNHRYYGAPFASTTMMSIAWRFPVLYDN